MKLSACFPELLEEVEPERGESQVVGLANMRLRALGIEETDGPEGCGPGVNIGSGQAGLVNAVYGVFNDGGGGPTSTVFIDIGQDRLTGVARSADPLEDSGVARLARSVIAVDDGEAASGEL